MNHSLSDPHGIVKAFQEARFAVIKMGCVLREFKKAMKQGHPTPRRRKGGVSRSKMSWRF